MPQRSRQRYVALETLEDVCARKHPELDPKEARKNYIKAVGKGIAGISRCRVREVVDERRMILTYDGHHWPVEQVWFGRHLAALTSHQLNVVWTINP